MASKYWFLGKGKKVPLSQLIKTPCNFSFKIIGPNTSNFIASVKKIIAKSFGRSIKPSELSFRRSASLTYIAITVTLPIYQVKEISDIYAALSKEKSILYLF